MELPLLPIGVGLVVVLLTELVFWRLFSARMTGLLLPREHDRSTLRFFTMNRMRMLAASHTFFLSVIVVLSFLWLW